MADRLAAAIMGITGRDIGEHSSAHCPWLTAEEHAEEYESERDALEAHVELLRQAGNIVIRHTAPLARADETIDRWQAAASQEPATSFARLKAQWQAEGWEGSANELELMECPKGARFFRDGAANHFKFKAAKLRRQAEGGEA